MNSDNRFFMGIDLTAQRNSFTCAVLDSSRKVKFCDTVSLSDWQSALNSYPDIITGINSPLTLNLGYMSDPEYRLTLNPIPPKSRYTEMRVCEYQLLCQGYTPTRTPKDVNRFSPGLQRAFKFTSELGMSGFQYWPFPNSRYQMLEVNADAAFGSLLGVKPFAANSLEGRIQRQLVLQNKGLGVKDAMGFFEEITRHRLLTGKLPDDNILSSTALNALISAFTAWSLVNRPDEYSRCGELDEGVIFLPIPPKNI
jgi:hypothetical protein